MRRGGAGLLVAVLALAGCKSTTGPKADTPKPDKDKTPAGVASRPKGAGPAWLDELEKSPLAGTDVPKGGPADAAVAAKGILGGTVFDPTGRGAKDVYIRIERADASADEKRLPPIGIVTGANGYFQVGGLKPGIAYTLTAEVKQEGKPLVGIVQTRPPNATMTIQLRDDVMPPGVDVPGVGPGGGLPPPSPDLIPPMSVAPTPTPTPRPAEVGRPTDGSFAPGGYSGTKPLPGPPPVGVSPAPTPPPPAGPTTLPAPTEVRPENTATGRRDPGFPPPASIPSGPPVPPLPSTPVPPLPPPPGGPQSSRPPGRPVGTFTLLDAERREWDLATSRHGSLVLVEFMTTTCVPCKKAIPVLTDLQAKYGASGLQVVGVVCDGGPVVRRIELARQYRSAHGLNYALYVEAGPDAGAVRDRLGVEGYPTVILIDASGREVYRGHPTVAGEPAKLEQAIRENLR